MTRTFTRKTAAALMGLAIAAGTLGAVERASAAPLTPAEAALLAGAGGFVIGALANEAANRRHHRIVDSWDLHVARCEARYMTYDEETDTYISASGKIRRCRL